MCVICVAEQPPRSPGAVGGVEHHFSVPPSLFRPGPHVCPRLRAGLRALCSAAHPRSSFASRLLPLPLRSLPWDRSSGKTRALLGLGFGYGLYLPCHPSPTAPLGTLCAPWLPGAVASSFLPGSGSCLSPRAARPGSGRALSSGSSGGEDVVQTSPRAGFAVGV